MKKPLKMISSIVALMLIITMVAMPTVANAASYNYNSSKSKGFNFSSMLQMATQRYQAVNTYKNYLNEMNKFTEGLDKNMSVDDSKIKIIDKANELQKKYNNDSNSSSISNTFATCDFGITKACPTVAGPASKITLTLSSSYKVVEGISPAAILQNIQSLIVVPPKNYILNLLFPNLGL